jgi:AraC family transcriptional regulator
MDLPDYDLSHPETAQRVFGGPPEIASSQAGWSDFYYERRGECRIDLPPHRVKSHWIVVKLNPFSEAIRTVEGRTVHEFQRRGAVAFLPHGCRHHVVCPDGIGERALMVLSPALLDRVRAELGHPTGEPMPAKFATSVDPVVMRIAQQIEEELLVGNPHGAIFGQVASHLLAVWVVWKYGYPEWGARVEKARTLAPSILRRLIKYIDVRLSEPISLHDLASHAGFSEYHFCRAFRHATGLPPHRFLIARRLEKARGFLKAGQMSVQDVAVAVGFSSASQLGFHFRKHLGVNPSRYRRNETGLGELQPVPPFGSVQHVCADL